MRIDSEKRASVPEISQLAQARERGLALSAMAKSGAATFDELVEGLKYQESVAKCAELIAQRDVDTTVALPALKAALENFGDYDAAQALRKIDPQTLMECLANPKATYEAASALGELGPNAAFALPALRDAFEFGPSEIRYALADAIAKIAPDAPKVLFDSEELSPAVSALLSAAESVGKERHDRVLNVYIEHGQDLNGRRRGEVIAFANAVRAADDELYRLFVDKLVESNPSLAGALKPRP